MTGPAPLPAPAPEVSVYRDHCVALLRRYFCMSVEIGRLPAILGRECFRTNAQDYHLHSFENIAIFVIDVERCLDRLHPFDKELIAHVVLQEYTQEEAARLMHVHRTTVIRRLPDALDALSEMFLAAGMLPLRNYRRRQVPADSATAGATGLSFSASADSHYPNDSSDDLPPHACQAPLFIKFPLSACSETENISVAHATLTPSNLLC